MRDAHLHALSVSLENFITHYGVFAVFLAMVLESACIPLPSELIMTYAGFEAFRHNIGFTEAIVAGVLGNLVGSLIAYYVGKAGGRPFLRRYGKYILFSDKHFASAERFFEKWGSLAVLISRILPAIRTFISLPAGIANMRIGKFILFSLIGCIPWVYLLAYIGYSLGQNWDSVSAHTGALTYIFGAILVLSVILFWVLNRSKKAQSSPR